MAFDVISCTLIICMNVVGCLMQKVPLQPEKGAGKLLASVGDNKQVSSESGAVVLNPNILSPVASAAAAAISSSTSTSTTTTKAPILQSNINNNNDDSYIESGAVMRGVFVFVGLTLVFIMYLVFKTYRKSHRKHVAIKKYGVRAKRTDTEMEPLQLDDEEEDETLFIRTANTR